MQKFSRFNFPKAGEFVKVLLLIIMIVSSIVLPQRKNLANESVSVSVKSKGMYILRADKDGRLYDREATPEEFTRYSLSKRNKKLNLTLVHSLNQPESVRGLKIILRATDQLMANPDALMSFRRAAARWERVINTPITVVIDVDYGLTRWGAEWGDNVLGSTHSVLEPAMISQGKYATVSDIKNALKNKHTNDAQLQSLYNAIPATVHSTAGSNFSIPYLAQINSQALGFLPAETNPDQEVNPLDFVPSIGFNSNFTYDFDPSDGIDSDKEDFDATVVHEIGHALGFNSIIGMGGDPNNYFTTWDLFRVRPEAVVPGSLSGFSSADRIVTPGPPPSEVLGVEGGTTFYRSNQVFFDGIRKIELSTGTGAREGGDGQQASHWRDDVQRLPSLGADRVIGIMDPVSQGNGIRSTMTFSDLRMLEVIGFDINYSPQFASISVKFENNTIDLDKSTDTLKLGDVNINVSRNVSVQFTNLSLDKILNYEAEIITTQKIPSSSNASLSTGSAEGSINSGQTANVNLTLNGGQAPSITTGIIRLHTNDENKLVIDIPFEFSSGNATAPTVAFSIPEIEDFRFDRNTSTNTLSKELTIYNRGTLDLEYNLITSLSVKNSYPTGLSLEKSVNGSLTKNNLSRFYDLKKINDELLFSTDFESGLSGFTKQGTANIEDWNLITGGKAANDGHSKPTAAYFGVQSGNTFSTRPNSNAMLVSPTINLAPVPLEDLVTLSFNYYLDAELGYDFASVLVSTDDGATYKEVATSNGGVLLNTTSWQPVLLQLQYLSGSTNPANIKIAFKFTSDLYENKEGFYVDDIQVHVLKEGNSVYTSTRSGVIPGNGSSTFTLNANKAKLQPGYYDASLTIQSNDPKHNTFTFDFDIVNLQLSSGVRNKLYAITYRSGGKLLHINSSNGSGAELGSAGMEGIKSLTINPVTLQLFAVNVVTNGTNIVAVDGQNGTSVFYVKPDVRIDAITFDQSGTLYGVGNDQNLYTINLETGKTSLIKKIGFKAASMAFHPATGELWIGVDALSDKDKLYKVNTSTGDTSLVGRTGTGKTTRGLVFDISNNLYGVNGEILQPSEFLSINQQNAAASSIGPVGFSAVFGLAMKPDTSTAVTQEPSNIPESFVLNQNYPNPFNPATVIKYQLPVNSHVTLKVYNILAQEVATLVNKFQTAGTYNVDFNAENLSTGIYLYELRADNFVSVKKMILAK